MILQALISNPYAKIAILFAVFTAGWTVKGWQVAGQDLKVVKSAVKEANKQVAKDDKILSTAAQAVAKIEIVYRDKIVEKVKYVKTGSCPKHDPDYVRVYNETVKELNSAIAGKTD